MGAVGRDQQSAAGASGPGANGAAKPEGRAREDYGWGWVGGVVKKLELSPPLASAQTV